VKKNHLFRLIRVSLPAIALLLSACASDEILNQPTELLAFKSSHEFVIDWHVSTGKGVAEQYVSLQPLLLNDIAVTVSRDGYLNAINLASGEVETELNLNATMSAGVGGNDALWLVATRDAYVIAIDAEKRVEQWRTRVPSEILANPVLYNDSVIVRTIDGKIISINSETGKIRWQYQRTIPDLTIRGSSTPVIARDRIFVGLADGRFIAISPEDGGVIWDVALSVPKGRSEIQRLVDIDGAAELYGRILYAASYQGRVAAIDVERGQFLWARDFSTHTGVTLDDKALYSSDDSGAIWAMDRLNGATLWKQDKLAYRQLTRPTIVGDYIVVGDFEGYIHLLSRYDGHMVARYQLGQYDNVGWDLATGIITAPVAYGEDRIVVTTRGGIMYMLNIRQRNIDSTADINSRY
jgi:outer membrane protein assembly factor BamB